MNNIEKRLGAGVLAASLTIGGIGVGGGLEVRAETQNKGIATIIPGEMPSQSMELPLMTKYEVEERVMNLEIETPSVSREVIFDLMEQYDKEILGGYIRELKEYGCTNLDAIETYARWMNIWDKCDTKTYNPKKINGYNEVQTYFTHQKVLDYSVSGKGLTVYHDEETGNEFLLLNSNKKIEKNFYATIEWFRSNGAENVVDCLKQHNFNAFFTYVFNKDGDKHMGLLWKEGLIAVNFDAETQQKDSVMQRGMYRLLVVESFGCGMAYLTAGSGLWSDIGYREIVKNMLVSANWAYLYNKTGCKNEELRILSSTGGRETQEYLAKLYRISIDDPYIMKLFNEITQGNLLLPFGAENWDFLEEGLGEIK